MAYDILGRSNIFCTGIFVSVFQERHLYNLGGTNFRASMRAAGATLMSPRMQGCYNVTGCNRAGHQKAACSKLSNVSRALHSKKFFFNLTSTCSLVVQ